jgi:hypothetical protein
MYTPEFPVDEIIELQDRVNYVFALLSPILFYLYQGDFNEALGRLYEVRDEGWMDWALETTSKDSWFQSRVKNDFSGWLDVAEEL